MSKKKSYMDMDSILSEGLWDSLVNILVPKSYIEKHKEYRIYIFLQILNIILIF